MSGKKKNRTKETPEQRELARIAAEKWNFSQQNLAPLMDQYMAKTDQMRSGEALAYQRGRSNEESQAQIAGLQQQVNQTVQGMGVDPSSGRAMMLNTQASAAGATGAADHASRAQHEQLNQHVVGLQNINAMGLGQAGQAQAGIGDIASANAQSQQQKAFNQFNRRSANMQLLGTVAGAATNYGLQQPATGQNGYAAKGNIADGNPYSMGL